MKKWFEGLEPESVFRYFDTVCSIPRPSYHEEKMSDYLEAFAADRGLFCYRDKVGNVFIRLPATAGQEQLPAILFQGHTDMVADKRDGVIHDFLTDPIEPVREGDFLHANGTTLGADDGIAVAIMLAILDGLFEKHPTVECLFTVSEEVGLCGAAAFDYSQVSARTLINLDSEELDSIVVGCAGGLRTDLGKTMTVTENTKECVSLFVGGLCGGHSGEDIGKERGNAVKIAADLLTHLDGMRLRLIRIDGGSKTNAIPRECRVTVAVDDAQGFIRKAEKRAGVLASRLTDADRNFFVRCERIETVPTAFDKTSSAAVISVLADADSGVLVLQPRKDGGLDIRLSRNTGVVRTEGNTVTVSFSSRSAYDSDLESSDAQLRALAQKTGCAVSTFSRYSGWEYAPVSAIREKYRPAYFSVTGKNVNESVIHAGLECGIIRAAIPDMDIISVGPDMKGIHSPDETLDLRSVEQIVKILQKLNDSLLSE